ncbi:capsular biosynthesis protein, partial [Chryseobacterium sp. HMWF028]
MNSQQSSPSVEVENNISHIDINEILKPYFRRWPWFILAALLALIIGYISLKFMTPIYNVQTTVLVKDAKNSSSPMNNELGVLPDFSGFGGLKTNSIANEIEILKSKRLMKEVIINKNLQTDIYAKSKLRKVELYKETSPIEVRVINEKQGVPNSTVQLKIEGNQLTVTTDNS